MSKRYTYTASLSFGTDGEPGYSEVEVEVSYAVVWGRPAQTYGPPEKCYPADPDEIDDIRLEKVEGKPRPWGMYGGWVKNEDDEFAADIVGRLEGSDHHLARMLEEAAEGEAADADDAAERAREDRRDMALTLSEDGKIHQGAKT